MSDDSLSAAFQDLADNTGKLVAEHVELAKLELKRDLQELFRDTLSMAVGFAWLAVGYVFLNAGVVLALRDSLGLTWAALLIAALNLVPGVALFAVGANKLRAKASRGLATHKPAGSENPAFPRVV